MPTEVDAPAVDVRALVKHYGKVEALRGVDLAVMPGEMFALLGPERRRQDDPLLDPRDPARADGSGAARVLGLDVVADRDAIRREMGIVFQEPAIEQRLSGRDNLMLMGHPLRGIRWPRAEERAPRRSSRRLGIAGARPTGSRRRSPGASAGSSSSPARSSPTRGSSSWTRPRSASTSTPAAIFWGQVRTLADSRKRTVFFTTHYMEEAEVADRIALIDSAAASSPSARRAELKARARRRGRHPEDGRRRARPRVAQGARLRARSRAEQAIMRSCIADPAAILPDLLRNLPVRVERAEVHAPSLEDVFLKLTGRGPRGGRGQAMMRAILAIVILDLKRFWLDRARLIAGLIQPLLYLFVLGAGIGASVKMGGGDYRRFIFPGTMGLSLLFSATFAAITIVFDRQIGFFKAILVAPGAQRSAIAFGKIIAGRPPGAGPRAHPAALCAAGRRLAQPGLQTAWRCWRP
jgi:ABC-2 type transport system ATP-binding protein